MRCLTGWSGDAGHVPAAWAAWELTGRISPRRVVRAATVDRDGRPVNAYPLLHRINGAPPATPWAVHLADAEGGFRLLCADLDAKTSPDAATRDAHRLSGLLTELGVPHLVCASGPSGGRHVWIALRESVDAELVGALARLLKAWLPTLDLAPLVNPVSGCVRPPGAPHRLGGASRVIAGTVSVLTRPTVTADQVRSLVGRLAEHVNDAKTVTPRGVRPVAESGGMPFLPGTRRALSPSCRALVDTAPTGDLSAVLWRILCGAAAAHWHYADVHALLNAPGLEHARTIRSGSTRTPRPATGPASPAAVLRRQWKRAVHAMATSQPAPTRPGDDVTFDARAEIVTAVVRTVQGRADSTPGRWSGSRAGLAQRRVLDALCLFHLHAVGADEVEADIRRLALTCGLDRETARRSLLALAADGWITRTHPSVGCRGARWTVDPGGAIQTRISQVLSQAGPRPTRTGPALRTVLVGELSDRLQAGSHDAFAPAGGLGLEAGSLYGRVCEPLATVEGARLMGWTMDKTTLLLGRLASAGLIVRSNRSWSRTDPEHLDRIAVERGTNGRHQRRADRYAAERAAWAWWQAELVTMRASRLARSQIWWVRVVDPDSVAWPPHPRRRGGRADFAAARRAVALGRQPGTMGRRELVRGGFHSVGQQCAPSQRLPKVTSLPPRNTRQNRTSALLARVTRLG